MLQRISQTGHLVTFCRTGLKSSPARQRTLSIRSSAEGPAAALSICQSSEDPSCVFSRSLCAFQTVQQPDHLIEENQCCASRARVS
ncbi:hypothetical protein AV530_003553 [Patagioenas fasciata monilis]|uniref:Uncharacterized protein n=1 Tax=Patagioenas fasciata monilis TaxID=372326 RepID=A0A1V4K2W4_PATFA|nr:hypothetical protein AV530_003553 [Patagioenas fasciata monilis]